MTVTATTYDAVAKTLHWFIAFAIFVVFTTTMGMELSDEALRSAFYTTHKTTGFFVLWLMVLRVLWMHYHPAPPLPEKAMPRWQLRAARLVHRGLYVFALLTPFIGWALVSMGPYGLKLFGVLAIPPLPFMAAFTGEGDGSDFVGEFHEISATLLVGLIVVHIGATILHHFVDRDDILLRISPNCTHAWLRKIRGG